MINFKYSFCNTVILCYGHANKAIVVVVVLSLNCHSYPKIKEPILPDFKKCWFLLAGVYCIYWFWGMIMYGNEFKAKGNKN